MRTLEVFMKIHRIAAILIITVLMASCASATTQPVVTENPSVSPTQVAAQTPANTSPAYPAPDNTTPAYPAPGNSITIPPSSAYPGPGGSGSGTSAIPASGYEPQPGDENLKRDMVNLDMNASQVVVTASEPAQAEAVLSGTMPDPCHNLRVVVTPADTRNTINIDLYSVVDPNTMCITTVDTFNALIPLGSYSSGEYTVNVNGQKLGTFQTVFSPQPVDNKLSRGDATVELDNSRISHSSIEAGSIDVVLKGYLPDPCSRLRIIMTPADPQNNINLEVYTVFDSRLACIMVIQPFNVIYPMGTFAAGHYSVYVNGEPLGEFDL
jgi:hypothetical protein